LTNAPNKGKLRLINYLSIMPKKNSMILPDIQTSNLWRLSCRIRLNVKQWQMRFGLLQWMLFKPPIRAIRACQWAWPMRQPHYFATI
jgi:hypothetical protein